jgi:site-specific recombinase XerC
VSQKKTKRPVSFEITPKTKDALSEWIKLKNLCFLDYLFLSSYRNKGYLEPRHYARLVKKWVFSIGLDRTVYGTHSMTRTKVALIFRQTKNLKAVQILLGQRSLESTVRYPGV